MPALLLDSGASGLSWQAFLIGNLVGLLALSFWLGRLKEQVTELSRSQRENLAKLEKHTDQAILIAELRTALGELQKQMHKLTEEFVEFRQSIWARAIEMAQPGRTKLGGD